MVPANMDAPGSITAEDSSATLGVPAPLALGAKVAGSNSTTNPLLIR
jgi:hypothetical protein